MKASLLTHSVISPKSIVIKLVRATCNFKLSTTQHRFQIRHTNRKIVNVPQQIRQKQNDSMPQYLNRSFRPQIHE